MIVSAAVKIRDLKQDKVIVIPCHRHCDVFEILHLLNIEYTPLAQGFLDEHDHFYNRIDAKKHAQQVGQITDTEFPELYSEDLW